MTERALVVLWLVSSDSHKIANSIHWPLLSTTRAAWKRSVVIFHKLLEPSPPSDSETTNWLWCYAKIYAQVADWTRHELTVHLVNIHFVEEAVIVATHRSFPPHHLVYRLLE